MSDFNGMPRQVIGLGAQREFSVPSFFPDCPLQNAEGEEPCEGCDGIRVKDIEDPYLRSLAETEFANGVAGKSLCHAILLTILTDDKYSKDGKPDDALSDSLGTAQQNAFFRNLDNKSAKVKTETDGKIIFPVGL